MAMRPHSANKIVTSGDFPVLIITFCPAAYNGAESVRMVIFPVLSLSHWIHCCKPLDVTQQ